MWPSYATRNSNQAPMSSAFMIECPLRLNNEHNNRGRLCNEKSSYTGAEKKEEKNVLRMRLEYTHTLPAGETQFFCEKCMSPTDQEFRLTMKSIAQTDANCRLCKGSLETIDHIVSPAQFLFGPVTSNVITG